MGGWGGGGGRGQGTESQREVDQSKREKKGTKEMSFRQRGGGGRRGSRKGVGRGEAGEVGGGGAESRKEGDQKAGPRDEGMRFRAKGEQR